MLKLILIGGFFLLCLAVLAVLKKGPSGRSLSIEAKPILTANEAEFFQRLRRALPEHLVFPQVAYGALLKTKKGLSNSERYSNRGRFSQKIADFVICRPTLEVVAIVELDDKTHDRAKDEKRDELAKAAGYSVLRYHSRRKPAEGEILSDIAALSNASAL